MILAQLCRKSVVWDSGQYTVIQCSLCNNILPQNDMIDLYEKNVKLIFIMMNENKDLYTPSNYHKMTIVCPFKSQKKRRKDNKFSKNESNRKHFNISHLQWKERPMRLALKMRKWLSQSSFIESVSLEPG